MFEILQMLCSEPEILKQRLREKYGERPALVGRTPDGRTFEFWANPTTRTWTVVLEDPEKKKSCVPVAGTDLEWGTSA